MNFGIALIVDGEKVMTWPRSPLMGAVERYDTTAELSIEKNRESSCAAALSDESSVMAKRTGIMLNPVFLNIFESFNHLVAPLVELRIRYLKLGMGEDMLQCRAAAFGKSYMRGEIGNGSFEF